MSELSVDCFEDRCRDCDWAGCTCKCHWDQEFDLFDGWVQIEDDDAPA